MADHQALLGHYHFNMWQTTAKFENALPEGSCKEFQTLLEEGTAAARVALQAASDAADSAARTMVSAISMRQASWLLLSGLSSKAQKSIQDLSFDGQALFADNKINGLKNSRTTLKTLGRYVLGSAHKRFKPQLPQGQRSHPWQDQLHKKPKGYRWCTSHLLPPSAQLGSTHSKQGAKKSF